MLPNDNKKPRIESSVWHFNPGCLSSGALGHVKHESRDCGCGGPLHSIRKRLSDCAGGQDAHSTTMIMPTKQQPFIASPAKSTQTDSDTALHFKVKSMLCTRPCKRRTTTPDKISRVDKPTMTVITSKQLTKRNALGPWTPRPSLRTIHSDLQATLAPATAEGDARRTITRFNQILLASGQAMENRKDHGTNSSKQTIS